MTTAADSSSLGNPPAVPAGHVLMVAVPEAGLQAAATPAAEMVSQLLYGECVTVLAAESGWMHVRGVLDDYEGYARSDTLSKPRRSATHRIINRATPVFDAPTIKSAVVHTLSYGSRIVQSDTPVTDAAFLQTDTGHFVWKAHCLPIERSLSDSPVDIVRQHFLATPYRWGGRSSTGLDCSGLVQVVAASIGVDLPRDSHDQERRLPSLPDGDALQQDDLIFWPGHVAWVVDADTVIHANAASLTVRAEPIAAVNRRAGAPSSCRRLPEPTLSRQKP